MIRKVYTVFKSLVSYFQRKGKAMKEEKSEVDFSEVPKEYYGQWIAVEKGTSDVLAHGATMKEVTDTASTKTSRGFVVTIVQQQTGGYLL